MGFNPVKFTKQQFVPREEAVEVNALWLWFDDISEDQVNWFNLSYKDKVEKLKDPEFIKPDDCTWLVRGLSASELAGVFDCESKNRDLTTVIEALGSASGKVDELKNVLGIGQETPLDIAKRLQQLVSGSVNPAIDFPTAVKLAENFPIEFYSLTNTITILTGQGCDLKKSPASG